ncbi:MAG: hypothetical protein AB7S86_01335 [Hydrogenophaga sp.]|uniref:hypothetical protein n=1 Tax=Hydrogenophaga sp. TaxID=1904254 RepID=UPI003D0EF67C
MKIPCFSFASRAALGLLTFSSMAVFAQEPVRLCANAMNPALSGMVLHWDRFNMFGNVRQTYWEKDFAQIGEGEKCRIASLRDSGAKTSRPCFWTTRMSCDLEEGKAPVWHTFTAGTSFQKGKLQWEGNEMLSVNVRRGGATALESRKVAVVKFAGIWTIGGNSGDSISTAYFDRDWGVLLKLEGTQGTNKFGDTVTLVEIQP